MPLASCEVDVDRRWNGMGDQALRQTWAWTTDECTLVRRAIVSHGTTALLLTRVNFAIDPSPLTGEAAAVLAIFVPLSDVSDSDGNCSPARSQTSGLHPVTVRCLSAVAPTLHPLLVPGRPVNELEARREPSVDAVVSCARRRDRPRRNHLGLSVPRALGSRLDLGRGFALRPKRKEALMADHAVVLAFFNDEASASAAATSLKDSGAAKGDDVGVLVLDEDGNLKAEQVGKRSWGKGAGIGAVVALVTPVGLAAGLIGGGLLGALHHKKLGLDEADRERISSELQRGGAAVGVLAPVSEATVVADKLKELGGISETHHVSTQAVEEAQAAALAES